MISRCHMVGAVLLGLLVPPAVVFGFRALQRLVTYTAAAWGWQDEHVGGLFFMAGMVGAMAVGGFLYSRAMKP